MIVSSLAPPSATPSIRHRDRILRCAHCPRHCARAARSPVQICKKSELLAGRASRVAMWPKSPRSYSVDRLGLAFCQAMTPGVAYLLHPARIRVRRGPNGRCRPRPHKSFAKGDRRAQACPERIRTLESRDARPAPRRAALPLEPQRDPHARLNSARSGANRGDRCENDPDRARTAGGK
jgi:hypothetical protein